MARDGDSVNDEGFLVGGNQESSQTERPLTICSLVFQGVSFSAVLE